MGGRRLGMPQQAPQQIPQGQMPNIQVQAPFGGGIARRLGFMRPQQLAPQGQIPMTALRRIQGGIF